jgi:polygalacturonase
MLFERLDSSGLGLTIGSIGNSTVENITFQHINMDHTYKGIYMKFRSDGGLIKNITYNNINMNEPSQYAIWIGPA